MDFPAFGLPTRPMSAMSLSSRRILRSSAGPPGVHSVGTWLVGDLNRSLPRPPLPPLAITNSWPSFTRSTMSSPVSSS